jgi:hypothetical protein
MMFVVMTLTYGQRIRVRVVSVSAASSVQTIIVLGCQLLTSGEGVNSDFNLYMQTHSYL